MRFAGKRSLYADMPRFLSQFAILLHGGPPMVSSWHDGTFDHRNRESIPICAR